MPFAARRGRPRKFTRPARTVTITLPDDVIEGLRGLDPDLGRAIVRLAEPLPRGRAAGAIEVASFGARAVILVAPNQVLRGIEGVELVPLSDGRAIIALADDLTEAQLELRVRDRLDEPGLDAATRRLLEQLAAVLQEARRTRTLTIRRIMVLRAADAAPPRNGRARRP